MASKLTISKKDEVHLQISCPDKSTLAELSERFEFYAPGYKFMPAFKARKWDGKIRLFNSRNNTIYAGLFPHICSFAQEFGYEVEIDDSNGPPLAVDRVDMSFVEGLSVSARGERIVPRDYQLKAVEYALTHRRALLLSPTASGKSLIIYLIIRYYLYNHRKPVLLVVPTTSLVEQMISDFSQYAENDSLFDPTVDCHGIYGGRERDDVTGFPVVVSTWQSIYQMPKAWFSQFGCVIGDEAHNFKAKSLTSIMTKMTNTDYRVGLTGTLDGSETNQLVLEGLFGPLKYVTTTRELMDSGALADLKVQVCILDYPHGTRKQLKGSKYHEEIDFIVEYPPRTEFITELVSKLSGNTLVLFQYVDKHGKPLFKAIRDVCSDDRKIFYVSGETNVESREQVRTITEKENDSVIVASIGTFSAGINIRNIHNIVFASPSKSQIRVLQAIGRGLRVSDDGRRTVVYDIADDLHIGDSYRNYTLNHAGERIKIYAREQFDYTIDQFKITDDK